MGPDHSTIPGRNGPEESTTWTYHPMHTVYHVTSASGRDAVLGYAVSTQSKSTSVKTDISCADISLLPSSVGLARHMPQPDNQLRLGDYESAMGEMTSDLVSLTRAVEPDVEAVKKNLEAEAQVCGVNK